MLSETCLEWYLSMYSKPLKCIYLAPCQCIASPIWFIWSTIECECSQFCGFKSRLVDSGTHNFPAFSRSSFSVLTQRNLTNPRWKRLAFQESQYIGHIGNEEKSLQELQKIFLVYCLRCLRLVIENLVEILIFSSN